MTQYFKCKEHGIFSVTSEDDPEVDSFLNYDCPECGRISPKSDYVGLHFNGSLPNMKN